MITLLLAPPLIILTIYMLVAAGGFMVQSAERGKSVRITPDVVSNLAREAAVRALFLIIAPLGWIGGRYPKSSDSVVSSKHPPVILLANPPINRSALFFLETFLRSRGSQVMSIHSKGTAAPLPKRAEELSVHIEQACKQMGTSKIDLVGFGIGGLVAGWFLAHLNGAERVNRFVSIGTPWSGTKMAVFGRSPATREAKENAPKLSTLTPLPVETTSIWSPQDPMIIPSCSAVAKGAQSVEVVGTGHLAMLLSARVCRAVHTALTAPSRSI